MVFLCVCTFACSCFSILDAYAPINVKPNYPPCEIYRGMYGDLHFRFNKSPPTGRVQTKQPPANQQVELTVLKKNVTKLCLCHTRSATTEANSFVLAARQRLKLHHEVLCFRRPSRVITWYVCMCTCTQIHGMCWLLIQYPLGVLWQNAPTNPPTLPARGVVGHDNDRCITVQSSVVLFLNSMIPVTPMKW